MNDEPLDLSGLRPRREVRERVVEGALERIGRPAAGPAPTPGPGSRVLRASAPYAVPALAAAAVVVLLLAGRAVSDPGSRAASDPSPRARVAEAAPAPAVLVQPPGPWDAWIAASTPPGARQLLVTFGGGP